MATRSSPLAEISSTKSYGGFQKRYEHDSSSCGCKMKFSVYLPPQANKSSVPVLYYLSGLSCTDENFAQKSNGQRKASELGLALVIPDTSPRGLGVEGEDDSWDFGVSAGFYLNATVPKWKAWRMYDYCTKELPELVQANLPQLDVTNASIFGHSMGGHGALTIALKNPTKYKSVSAFAPIVNPASVPWGKKAFTGYLGDDQSAWKEYDATELMKDYKGPHLPMLIDQGTGDNFYPEQLQPEKFQEACNSKKYDVQVRFQEGYDHSYYFISSFVDDHIELHAKALNR